MLQNTTQYAKIISIAFLVFVTAAVINYFFPNKGDVKWLSLEKAIEKAGKQNKPILLYPYLTLTTSNKIANQSIFSNDTIVKYINENLVPAGLNLNNDAESQIAKNRYQIDNGNYTLLLDKNGRGIAILSNTMSPSVYLEYLQKIVNFNYLKFPAYNEAATLALAGEKKLLVFVTNNYLQNIDINDKLSNAELMNFINENFIPSSLISFDKSDKIILKKYSMQDNSLKFNLSENKGMGIIESMQDYAPVILILDNTDTITGKIVLESNTDIKKELENIINKHDNPGEKF